MPSGKHLRGRLPKKAENVQKIKGKNTPTISKHIKTNPEERPAVRRSTRIQQLTSNSVRSSVFKELRPIKRPPRNRKVNVTQPTEITLKPEKSGISQQSSQKNDTSPVNNPVLNRISRTRTQTQPVLSWLENVDTTVGENVDSTAGENSQVPDPADSFEMPKYSSSVIEAPTLVSHTATSKKTIRPQISQQKFRKLLRARNAFPSEPSKDDQTKHFLSALDVFKSSADFFDGTDELWALFSSLDGCKKDTKSFSRGNLEQLVERMTDELHKWRTMLDLAAITESEFTGDRARCQNIYSNEAELQRTLFVEILNHHQLHKMFILRFEGQWKSQGTSALPSTDPMDTGISAPKPDLAIFFNFESLGSSSAPIPHDVETSLLPEGHAILCFPFLFIEAKKRFDPLDLALEKNFHTANQALFNIFRWMEKAGKLEDFFKNVRTVSIALNAREIIVRVHRAELSTGSLPLDYAYDDLTTIYQYTKNQACRLIRSMLLDYGFQKLHTTLKDTFQTVSELYAKGNYSENVLTKRKSDSSKSTYPSKRTRSKGKMKQTTGSQSSDSNSSFVTST